MVSAVQLQVIAESHNVRGFSNRWHRGLPVLLTLLLQISSMVINNHRAPRHKLWKHVVSSLYDHM